MGVERRADLKVHFDLIPTYDRNLHSETATNLPHTHLPLIFFG